MKQFFRKSIAAILTGAVVATSMTITAFAEETATPAPEEVPVSEETASDVVTTNEEVTNDGVAIDAETTAEAPVPTEVGTYKKVQEIHDWGAATSKVVVALGESVRNIEKDAFKVYVTRTDERVEEKPVLEQGYRKVTSIYVSDADGNKVTTGEYATIEMEIGPKVTLGSPLNYYDGSNVWIDCDYIITQQKEIQTVDNKVISGLEITEMNDVVIPLVNEFDIASSTQNDERFGEITMSYASYDPTKRLSSETKSKFPLIIWLHGGGEGGTDATIPLSANKACNLASPEIQRYFGGAYVLVPQAPTKWMDDGVNENTSGNLKTNADSMYSKVLMDLIKEYVAANDNIDESRIYVGGCSNGGFMTMRLLLDNPRYFAAAYSVCEGMKNEFITDEDIEKLKGENIWFVTAATDTTLPAPMYTLPTYDRLIKAGAQNVHLTYFERVIDTTGKYKTNGNPYEYDGHWTWTYVYNNLVDTLIDGKTVTLMNWMANQTR